MNRHIIEPIEPSPLLHAVELLVRGGWLPTEADWLAPSILSALEQSGVRASDGPVLTSIGKAAFEKLATARECLSDSAMALVFSTWVVSKELSPPIPEKAWQGVLSTAASSGLDMGAGLARLSILSESVVHASSHLGVLASNWQHRMASFARTLYASGCIDLKKVVGEQWLQVGTSRTPWHPPKWPTAQRSEAEKDGSRPLFWLLAVGEDAAESIADTVVSSADVDDLLARSRAFGIALCEWLTSHATGGLASSGFAFEQFPERARKATERVLLRLDEFLNEETKRDEGFMSVWMRFARIAYERRSAHLSSEVRVRVRKLAADQVGRFRSLFSSADSASDAVEFSSEPATSMFNDSCFMLFEMGTLWEAWKPLLLAFRALNAPALAPDLRFWNENSSLAPVPWQVIPSSIVMMFHHHAKKEQDLDASFSSFRSDFARYCLERLKSKKVKSRPADQGDKGDSGDLVEPDPTWRYCFIRAVCELRTNPGGDGHHVLHWSSKNDPDDGVKEAAKEAYNEVRRGDRLGDMSPRRAILQAFWWLEQAHMLALGQEVDGPGAQRTRERMVRLTTE